MRITYFEKPINVTLVVDVVVMSSKPESHGLHFKSRTSISMSWVTFDIESLPFLCCDIELMLRH